MKRTIIPTLLALTILPSAASAFSIAELQSQIEALVAQIAAIQTLQGAAQVQVAAPQISTASAACPNLTRTLSRGMRGGDVAQLQAFLIAEGYLAAGNDSGFYGGLTESAVQRFQCTHLQICSGSPYVNGYGVVGTRTRAAVAGECRTVASSVLPPQNEPLPTSAPSLAQPMTAPTVSEPPVATVSTYYVDNTCPVSGNGATQSCAATLGAAGAFNSLAAMTGKSGGYAPGDEILLRRGQTFREMLAVPSSGIAGKPIRIASYGEGARPIILGSDTKKTWQPDGGGVYVSPIEWSPNMVFQSGMPLTRSETRANMNEGSFFVDTATSKIYVWPRGAVQPDAIEITRRPQNYYGLVMDGWTGNSWIEFDGLEVKNSNWMSYRIFGGRHVTIKNSTISNGFFNAIIAMGTGQGAASDPDGLKILDNAITNHGYARAQGHDGAAAISVDGADGFAIERNLIDTNYGEGIESYNTANNGTITGNTIRNQQMSGAIYVNASFGRPTSQISVRNNTVTGGSDKAHTALTVAIEGTGSISNITMADNKVSGYPWGGGLVVGSGAGTIRDSVFENNTISSSLHGIEIIGSAGLTFSNNLYKNNTVTLSSNGSALLVTDGGAAGNTFTGNTFSSTGSSAPIYWLGKYYSVAEWQTLMSIPAAAPAVSPPTPSVVPAAPTSSCVYGSNSGAVRTLASTYTTKDACVSACIAVRDSQFGISDSGACTYIDTLGVSTQTTISPIACIYSSNTGSIKYAPVTSSTTRESCKASCLDVRTQHFGASDTGVCLYYGPTGTQEMIAVP